jgi:hypothetical protein
MSTARDNGVNAVRPPISWKAHKAFYVFVFLVTGVLIYQWGWLKADRSQPAGEYTATASVRHDAYNLRPAGVSPAESGRNGSAPDDIRGQILSTPSLERAVREVEAWTAPRDGESPEAALQRAVEDARRALLVEVTEKPASGEMRVAITSTQAQPQPALLLANTLTEHYAADFRTRCRAAAQDAFLTSRDASQRAQRDLLQATGRLEKAEKEQQQQAGRKPAEAGSTPAVEPKPAEDPQWTELSGQLTRLQQRRAALLIDRLPAHPAVQEAELRIAETKRLLDATPRWTAVPQSPTPAGKQPAVVERKIEPSVSPAETARQLQQLRDAVAQATQINETAAAAERRARHACEQEPRIDVQLAQTCEATAAEAGGPGVGLLFASLFVGLVAAAGVCLVGVGVSIEPTINNIAELESLLGAPVVGAIPTDTSDADPADTTRRQQLTRWALIGGGGVLLFLCILLARWTLGG